MDSEGKIIAVVGAQSSGKSTLVNRIIVKNSLWKGFFEGESFPKYVTDAFSNPEKRLQAFLYFHNKWVKQYTEAERLRQVGKVVVLDNYWLSNLFFIDTLMDENEKKLIIELMKNTSQLFRPPDGIIYLDIDLRTMIKRIAERSREGGRFWENTGTWLPEPINVLNRYNEFFEGSGHKQWISEKTKILKIKAKDKELFQSSVGFIQGVGTAVCKIPLSSGR